MLEKRFLDITAGFVFASVKKQNASASNSEINSIIMSKVWPIARSAVVKDGHAEMSNLDIDGDGQPNTIYRIEAVSPPNSGNVYEPWKVRQCSGEQSTDNVFKWLVLAEPSQHWRPSDLVGTDFFLFRGQPYLIRYRAESIYVFRPTTITTDGQTEFFRSGICSIGRGG